MRVKTIYGDRIYYTVVMQCSSYDWIKFTKQFALKTCVIPISSQYFKFSPTLCKLINPITSGIIVVPALSQCPVYCTYKNGYRNENILISSHCMKYIKISGETINKICIRIFCKFDYNRGICWCWVQAGSQYFPNV